MQGTQPNDSYIDELNQLRIRQSEVLDTLDEIRERNNNTIPSELEKIRSDALTILMEIDKVREDHVSERQSRAESVAKTMARREMIGFFVAGGFTFGK